MNSKQTEIIESALDILREQGYAALTLRNLAKACDMKLASLQYHFKNRQLLIEAIAQYILATAVASWEEALESIAEPDITDFIDFAINDLVKPETYKLWPQLWAMGQVEPAVKHVVERTYFFYLEQLEQHFEETGSSTPKEQALLLASALEGMMLYAGLGKANAAYCQHMRQHLLAMLQHGEQA